MTAGAPAPAPARRIGLTLLALALGWAAWDRGGLLLAWAGLDELDLPGRVCLVFAVLLAMEAVLARLPQRGGAAPHG